MVFVIAAAGRLILRFEPSELVLVLTSGGFDFRFPDESVNQFIIEHFKFIHAVVLSGGDADYVEEFKSDHIRSHADKLCQRVVVWGLETVFQGFNGVERVLDSGSVLIGHFENDDGD